MHAPAPPWSAWTWQTFTTGVVGFAARDDAYLACLEALGRHESMRARAGAAPAIVTLLNRWACRLDRERMPLLVHHFIEDHADTLEALRGIAVADDEAVAAAAQTQRLYDDALALKAEVRNVGDAAVSKLLHLLLPDLVVMWDKAIKAAAHAQGAASYADFLVAMHELSRRLLDEAGMTAPEAEAHLRDLLGGRQPTTLAKHLDEASWWWIVAAR